MSHLFVLASGQPRPSTGVGSDDVVVSLETLKSWLTPGALPDHLLQFHAATFVVGTISAVPLALKVPIALRALTRGPITILDRQGRRLRVGAGYLTARSWRLAGQQAAAAQVRSRYRDQLDRLGQAMAARSRPVRSGERPYFLRTDLVLEPIAGGAVAHTAGVLGGLANRWSRPPRLVSASSMPLLDPRVIVDVVLPSDSFWDSPTLPRILYDTRVLAHLRQQTRIDPPAFLYHRHSAFSIAGALGAQQLGVPLVLEYNGSEVWIARNWGEPMADEALAREAEERSLAAADHVVVVSEPLAEEVAARGVDETRIILAPNGVDPKRYTPELSGAATRAALDLHADDLVIGFVGTFGRWHGAEVLAESFSEALAVDARLRLLLVGDGLQAEATREVLDDHDAGAGTRWAGMVPQADTPSYLAACDVLVAPHTPTPDGSTFFGSPTKLFEYMAMGRPVIASALGQLAGVITHERNGLHTVPGDVTSLTAAILRLAGDADLRRRLGRQARTDAVARHTWDRHVGLILDRLG